MTAEEQFQQTLELFIPATEDLDSLQLNTAEILELLKAQIEKTEQKELEDQQALEEQALLPEEEEEEQLSTLSLEPEIIEEEQIDYMQLVYDEMVLSNSIALENQTAIMEQLDQIKLHGQYSNETDGMLGLYLMWIIPFFVIIYFFTVIIKPFTRF